MTQVPEQPKPDLDADRGSAAEGRSVGIVTPQRLEIAEPITLECGRDLPSLTVEYETYGTLNAAKSNAVYVCHALSGDAHVAGYHAGQDPDDPNAKPGWWDMFIGPGRPLDTEQYFVICANVLGGCKGTTGPASIDPATGKPFGLTFPIITIGDMVDVHQRVVDHLGIDKLLCVIGGSMGGMQVLEWAVRFPDRVHGIIPVATTASLSAQSLAFDAVGRNAIQSDPDFHSGDYESQSAMPARGLAIARMLGHITYLSEEWMLEKFGRNLRASEQYGYQFNSEFSVETYLDHQGSKFVERFDANTYLYITRAMDYFDLGATRGGLNEAMRRITARSLVISFRSDWLFTPGQSRELVDALSHTGHTVSYVNIDSPYGHDAFLLEPIALGRAVRGFLKRLERVADPVGSADVVPELINGSEDRERRIDFERIERMIGTEGSVLDLGCGDGLFLHRLWAEGGQRVQGVDIDQENVMRCIERGVDVIQADLDQPLSMFTEGSYDHVLLSRTLQTVRRPAVVLEEMLRIGRRCVVTFPNFGYWRNRHFMAWMGRVPVSRNLPYSWIDTPNLHHLTMKDFEDWCRKVGVRVEARLAMDYEGDKPIHWLPNLRGTDAIYMISRNSS